MALDMQWIIPGLAQGSYPEPLKDAFRVADVLVLCAKELQARNVNAPPGKMIIRIPMDDDIYRPVNRQNAMRFHQTAELVANHVRAGRRVLVTCAAGMNRSGVVTALALMRVVRMPPRNAIALIRQRRPRQGDAYPLMNPLFQQFIENARVA